MDNLIQEIEALTDAQREAIFSSPSIRDGFSRQISSKLEVEYETVKAEIEKYVAKHNKDIKRVIEITKAQDVEVHKMSPIEKQREKMIWYESMIVEPLAKALAANRYLELGYTVKDFENIEFADLEEYRRRIRNVDEVSYILKYPDIDNWDNGESRRTKERKVLLYDGFISQLGKTEIPLSRSTMLRELSMDNNSNRKLADDVLNYLVGTGKIIKFARKYVLVGEQKQGETEIHRYVYELIAESPVSESNIIKQINNNEYTKGFGICMNKKGRIKLRQEILIPLQANGLIEKKGTKWSFRIID
ncbi:hypothetical protein CL614_02505 [archaeon]|nr:hypothetical protein [archaeon]|tara:strand:- start:1114 stop:2022 length:909 start_codon:yes stop_codon:yes gene_type:complete